MTDPQSITVSLEKAKELKKAGWLHESHFMWEYRKEGSSTTMARTWYLVPWSYQLFSYANGRSWAPAPTAEEILRRLPEGHQTSRKTLWDGVGAEWFVMSKSHVCSSEASLANAAAAMYCYLSANNLLPHD